MTEAEHRGLADRQLLDADLSQPVSPTPATGLTITGDQRDGLSDMTRAGAQLEAINRSAAPTGRYCLDDTTVVGQGGRDGSFSLAKLTGDLAMREGDGVRVRARFDDGTTSDWVTLNATGLGGRDTRHAAIALFRIRLTAAGPGTITVTNIDDSWQSSEPGVRLRFVNQRTREATTVTLDARGTFPAGLTLKGRAGDVFSVAASDGADNVDFAEVAGALTVPGGQPGTRDLVPDPGLHRDELDAWGKARFG
ncbi:MAG: hypothetical protein INH41_19730, partial [Myxococcaceae bacterium]|nr:hypothetical protein [Myxococcaceae bacterium]